MAEGIGVWAKGKTGLKPFAQTPMPYATKLCQNRLAESDP